MLDVIRSFLRAVREERKLSVEALAERCGVTAKTIYNLEQGKNVYWPTLARVCGVLGVTLKPEKVRQ